MHTNKIDFKMHWLLFDKLNEKIKLNTIAWQCDLTYLILYLTTSKGSSRVYTLLYLKIGLNYLKLEENAIEVK